RRDAGADPHHPRGGEESEARGLSLAGQAVRGSGGQRAGRIVGGGYQPAGRARSRVSRFGARRGGAARATTARGDGREPGLGGRGEHAAPFRHRRGDLPKELALRRRSLRARRLTRAGQGGPGRAAPRGSQPARSGVDGRRPSRRYAANTPSRRGLRPRALPRERASAAGHDGKRRDQAHHHDALPRSGPGAALAEPAAHSRSHPGRPLAPRHALLRDDLHHAPARAVGRPRGREEPGAQRGRLPAPPRFLPPGCPRVTADRRSWHGLLLLAPALVTLGALTLYPTVWVLWLSLQRRVPIFDVHRFEGIGNYLFLATDPRFWKAAQV